MMKLEVYHQPWQNAQKALRDSPRRSAAVFLGSDYGMCNLLLLIVDCGVALMISKCIADCSTIAAIRVMLKIVDTYNLDRTLSHL
jgi:hypothetical protein